MNIELLLKGDWNKTEKEINNKKKKRKFNTANGETVDKTVLISKKTKTFKENDSTNTRQIDDVNKLFQLQNMDKYIRVVANPKVLPSTPQIFQKRQLREETDSQFFFKDFLSFKSFNADLKSRFSFIGHEEKSQGKKYNEMEKERIAKNSRGCNNDAVFPNKEKKTEITKVNKLEGKLGSHLDADCEEEEKDEKITSQVEMYEALEKKGVIFHMYHPCTFSFHGELKLTLIAGEVEILGLTLSQSSALKTTDTYSPNLFTPLTVESKEPQQSKTKEEIRNDVVNILSAEDINKLLSKMQPFDSVLLVRQIDSDFGVIINKYFSPPLFPKDLEDVSLLSESLKSLQSIFNFTLSKNSKQIRKSSQWDRIPKGDCTVLCGGKGVGKSTLLKYFINKLVGQGERALCLDFDPGQPEFTPPGCISAVLVNKPLLGPNFTHLIHPEIMVYVGEVDVSKGPAKYLECVNYVIQFCKKNEELTKMKWFVNTMGFSKGLGVELMVSIIKLLKPNTVIQIKSSDYRKNYPFYLTPSTINLKEGLNSIEQGNGYVMFDLHVIGSCAERKGKAIQGGLKPRQLRDILSLSYFSQMMSAPYYNFNAVQPYLISFSKLYLGVDFLIQPNEILKAFNGNTVSLSYFEPYHEEILLPEIDDYFKIVVKPKIAPILGLGFIRGIDNKEKKMYLITHISMEELEKVNCLSLGRISPPHAMFLKQETVEGPTVYTSVSSVDVVQRVKRMFRVPPSQQNTNTFG